MKKFIFVADTDTLVSSNGRSRYSFKKWFVIDYDTKENATIITYQNSFKIFEEFEVLLPGLVFTAENIIDSGQCGDKVTFFKIP